MQCAEGTQCTPSGLSYDFAVENTNSGGTSTSGSSTADASRTGIHSKGSRGTTFVIWATSVVDNCWLWATAGLVVAVVMG